MINKWFRSVQGNQSQSIKERSFSVSSDYDDILVVSLKDFVRDRGGHIVDNSSAEFYINLFREGRKEHVEFKDADGNNALIRLWSHDWLAALVPSLDKFIEKSDEARGIHRTQ